MSMNTYPLIERAGFIIDEKTAACIILADNLAHHELPDDIVKLIEEKSLLTVVRDELIPDFEDYMDIQYAMEILNDKNVSGVVFASEFSGEIEPYFEGLTFQQLLTPISTNMDNDFLCYIEPDRSISYYEQAYASSTDILNEVRKKLGDILPKHFPYERNLVKITGTYFC